MGGEGEISPASDGFKGKPQRDTATFPKKEYSYSSDEDEFVVVQFSPEVER